LTANDAFIHRAVVRTGDHRHWQFNQSLQFRVVTEQAIDEGYKLIVTLAGEKFGQRGLNVKRLRPLDPRQEQGHDMLAETTSRAIAGVVDRVFPLRFAGFRECCRDEIGTAAGTVTTGAERVFAPNRGIDMAGTSVAPATLEAP